MSGLVTRLLGISLVGIALWWLWAWLHPDPERIQIVDPADLSTVHSPVTVRGVGTAIFENHPLERRFRDIHTVTQQLQGQLRHFETVGAWMMGVDTDLSFV